MEINLALNTILYIMIFLFPGILFRKFRFIGHDFKQFDKGNLFERFILTVLTSIVILVISFSIFSFIKNTLGIGLLESISYATFKAIFDALAGNELPTEDKLNQNYTDYAILLSAIYVLSFILGVITYFISNTRFIKSFGIFKRHNYWHDLIMRDVNKENKLSNKLVLGYTLADVLIETNESTKLYSGRIEDYFLCSTGELETLVLSRVKRYKITEKNKVIQKEVPGQAFIVDNKRIVNINLTYVYVKKESRSLYKNIVWAFNLLSIILIICVFLSPFTSYIDRYTDSILMKIFFTSSSVFAIALLNDLFKTIVYGKFSKQQDLGSVFGIISGTCVAMLSLGIMTVWVFLIILAITIIIMVIIMGNKPKKDNANSLDK